MTDCFHGAWTFDSDPGRLDLGHPGSSPRSTEEETGAQREEGTQRVNKKTGHTNPRPSLSLAHLQPHTTRWCCDARTVLPQPGCVSWIQAANISFRILHSVPMALAHIFLPATALAQIWHHGNTGLYDEVGLFVSIQEASVKSIASLWKVWSQNACHAHTSGSLGIIPLTSGAPVGAV